MRAALRVLAAAPPEDDGAPVGLTVHEVGSNARRRPGGNRV
jgi:hypothetical protein